MTSDAKIGLLLGLVFIFVIAFIINGLPNLRPQTGKAEVTTAMKPTTDEDFGVLGQAQKAQESLRWNEPSNSSTTPAVPTTVEPTAPVAEPAATASDPDTHSILPVPSIQALLDRIAGGLPQKEQQTTVSMDVPRPPTTQPPVATDRPPAVEPLPAKPAEPVAAAPDIREAARSVTALERAGWKVYVVGEGESLASVAKKVYGPEDGNRIANIKRIYEANKDIVKSINEVGAGQRLVIPPPLPPKTPKPEDVLSQALFEKVDAVGSQSGTKAAPTAKPPAVTTTEGRWYIVQDGDNLWKIAASQLGSGTRYEEIAKLNADLLKSRDTLDPGMRLRLPAK